MTINIYFAAFLCLCSFFAGAPKLLEMLELTESNLSRLIDAQHHDKALMTPWRDCVRAAIAKAKGE